MYEKIVLVGNLGKDPVMRYTPTGQQVCDFSLATSEKWTGQDGQLNERTKWWTVEVWGKTAENCNQYLKKGSRVLVEARMKVDPKTGYPRLWTGKDGTVHSSLEVTASIVKFLSSRGDHAEAPAEGAAEAPAAEADDEIPF